MADFNGTIYSSGTITTSGNSGWLSIGDLVGSAGVGSIARVWLAMVPANLTSTETMDLDLNVAFNAAGDGDVKVHDFTQVTNTNVRENLILPGGESANNLQVNAGTDFLAFAPIPPYWKFTWTLAGGTISMDFTVYGSIIDR